MTSVLSIPAVLAAKCSALLNWLTRPHPRVPLDQRSRSRILATLLLIYIPTMTLVTTWSWVGTPLQVVLMATPLVAILIYIANRSGYFRAAAWIAVLKLFVPPVVFLLTLHIYTFETVTFGALLLLTPLFLCYILLEMRDLTVTLMLIGSTIIGVLALKPGITVSLMSMSLFFLLWTSVLLLVSAILRHQDKGAHQGRLAALRETEARYRTLFSTASEGILVHQQGRVLDCNLAFAEMMGFTQDEVRGMDAMLFYAPEERERAKELIKLTEPYQVQGVRRDGTRIWAEVHGQPMLMNGTLVRVVTVIDITERKRAEEQAVAIAVEKEKVAILQRFITNVSHDLRTPLSTINTGLYLIGKVKDDPARLEVQIASVQDQVSHLERLINDLLSMSRLDRRKTGEYKFSWHDVNELIAAAASEFSAQAEHKHQALSVLSGNELPRALLDEREFRRMMQHLIQNAINFTPEGGEVTISTAHEGEEIVIAVHDTGIGISDADRGHIFDYFYRGDQARSPDTGGTGLGLTIAKRICEAHNGCIEVESAPGNGSTFCVRLPVTRRMLPETAPLATP